MGKYTTYNEPWIDKAIDTHLQLAVRKIKDNLPGVLAIYLAGGFGRGEGSVKLTKSQQVIPINDYDIYLITKNSIDEEIINNLAKDIEQALGSKGYSLYGHSDKEFYFDIRLVTKDKLAKLLPLIKYYELKYTSTLLDGQDLMPDFDKNDLPFSDGLRFLMNRICHITEWFLVNYIKDEPVEDRQRETLIYDMSKTYIECCTILTLLRGYYQPTYQARLEQLVVHQDEFKELWQRFPSLLDKIQYFTKQKLEPNFEEIKDIKKTWLETRQYALGVLEFILKKKYDARDWRDFQKIAFSNYFKPYLRFKLFNFSLPLANLFLHKYLNMLWFWRLIKFKKIFYWPLLWQLTDPGIKIFYASLFLVQAIRADEDLDKKMMSAAVEILESIYPLKEIKYDLAGYDALRKSFADIWRLYYLQKLI